MALVDVEEIRLSERGAEARWDELVSRSAQADVYHRAAYVIATAEIEHSQPFGLVVTTKNQQFLLPILLRPIAGPTGESWLDACTPYGYGGVICRDSPSTCPDPVDLFQGLKDWCASRSLICCVLRSHPLLEQEWLFRPVRDFDFVNVTRRGETTAVPLDAWDNTRDCPPRLSKGRRSDLANGRRNLRVTSNDSETPADAVNQLRIFRDLYEKTMQRLDATEFFHFPWSYYERLASLMPGLRVVIAWHEESPAGGALFMAGPGYAHYHLSATNALGQKFKASTLLVVEGARWARARGCRKLHLGGGMLLNDSLMAFKRSFGGAACQFGQITLIGDHARYLSLCAVENSIWPYQQKIGPGYPYQGEVKAGGHDPDS